MPILEMSTVVTINNQGHIFKRRSLLFYIPDLVILLHLGLGGL